MIKKKLLTIIVVMITVMSFGQKLYKKDLLNLEKSIYKEALQNYDLDAAKNAIYHIIKLEGADSAYMDSLAYIYFNQKNYVSTLQVANKILKKNEKLPILELKAISLESLNALKEAVEVYEKIFAQKKDMLTAYKLADVQQKIGRFAEAYATLKSVENHKFPEKGFVTFPTAKKEKVQNVPFKAAYYNALAKASYELHNYDEAIKNYEKALEVFPDFFLAKQNKQAIKLLQEKLKTQENKEKK